MSACGDGMPADRNGDREQRNTLLMRQPEEPFGPAVRAQRIEPEAERAVEQQVEPKGGPLTNRPGLDVREHAPACPRDEAETNGRVELDRVRRAAVTAPGEEAADPAERVCERDRDGEVVRAAHEALLAHDRERGAGD
jgi:hypothetical protein